MENQIISINLVPNMSTPAVVNVSQYDVGRPLVFKVYDGTSPADLTGVTAVIEGTKRSGLGFSESGTVSNNTVTLDTTLAMTQEDGSIPAEIRFTKTGEDVGTANFILAVEKSPHLDGTTDGTTETMADLQSQLDALDTRVEALEEGGGGLTQTEKNLILTLFSKAAYAESNAETTYDALEALWTVVTRTISYNLSHVSSSNTTASVENGQSYTTTLTATGSYTLNTVTVTMGGVDITSTAYSSGTITIPSVTGNIVITATAVLAAQSITATYTQSGTVYDTDSLDSLKTDLVVTANYAGGTSETVPSSDYTLSGTLTEGTSTITVSYAGLTDTFSVTVTAVPPYTFYDYIQGDGKAYINTGLLASTYCTNDYEQEVKVAGHTTESSKAVCGARQQWGAANARSVWHTNATYSQTYCGKDTGYTMSGSSLDVPVVIKTTTDKKIYCDEDLVDTATGAVSITHTGPITLFAECTSGQGSGYAAISGTNAYAGAFSKSRIYYFKVKDGNGNLVADLRPAVRISDSAIGMYDLIRDEFYQNARDTGALSVGNE